MSHPQVVRQIVILQHPVSRLSLAPFPAGHLIVSIIWVPTSVLSPPPPTTTTTLTVAIGAQYGASHVDHHVRLAEPERLSVAVDRVLETAMFASELDLGEFAHGGWKLETKLLRVREREKKRERKHVSPGKQPEQIFCTVALFFFLKKKRGCWDRAEDISYYKLKLR